MNFSCQDSLSAVCELIVPDLRGHGESTPVRTPFTLSAVADDMAALLSRLACEQAVLFGYSQGGSIALECLLRYPEMFAGAILVSSFSEVSDLY
ncbi:alpha/beta hydrolase, partial [Microbacteriaceae bacterium K1510]|nr:alpha/beta hydrolase [Microbacteriaceae bacterium K1510]